MLRRQGIRAFSSVNRRPFRFLRLTNRLPNGSSFTIQRVRFQRPPIFTRKRITNTLLYALPAYVVWHYFFPAVNDLEVDDQAQRVAGSGNVDVKRHTSSDEDEDEADGTEDDEDAIFIPFSWPKKIPKTYYRGSDPEWKAYVKFSKDKKMHIDVQQRLISLIRSDVSQRRNLKRYFGQVDITSGHMWLDFHYPPGPPLEYEVSGLSIGEEYIAWVRKPMSQVQYQKLERIMMPTAAFWSVWAATKYLLGIGPVVRRADDPIFQSQLQKRRGESNLRGQSLSAGSKTVGDTAKQRTASQDASASSKDTTSRSPDPEQVGFGFPKLPGLPYPNNQRPFTLMIFMRSMSQNMKPYSSDPPRGSIMVTGQIEVVGTIGTATLGVEAAYDPKSSEFVACTYEIRNIQARSLLPRGGA